MAKVYISEFASGTADQGRGVPAGFQPAIVDQTVAIGTANAQSSVFNANTRLIRVHTDAIISIKFGTDPTATSNNARLAANQTEYFGVPDHTTVGYKMAVITNS